MQPMRFGTLCHAQNIFSLTPTPFRMQISKHKRQKDKKRNTNSTAIVEKQVEKNMRDNNWTLMDMSRKIERL